MIEKTKKDIIDYLDQLKALVEQGRFRVALNGKREDNRALFRQYALKREDLKTLLMSLSETEFVKAVENEHEAYRDEELFIFGPERIFLNRRTGEKEKVPLYVKTNLLKEQMVIVVSCHRARFQMRRVKEEKDE